MSFPFLQIKYLYLPYREFLFLFIKVMKIPSSSDISLVTWKLNNRGINSEEAISEVTRMYEEYTGKRQAEGEPLFESKIVEEKNNENEYHVIVEMNHTPDIKVIVSVKTVKQNALAPFKKVYSPLAPEKLSIVEEVVLGGHLGVLAYNVKL